MSEVTAAALIIGNEILSGRTQDANLNYIAQGLLAENILLREARVIPDIEAEIIAQVRALSDRYDYVFTTGGIGPTHDDITAESIAKAFGRRLLRDPRAVALLARHYADPALLTEARLRMANIPEGAELIANPVSAAPGFHLENVFVFAGVPAIARAMFDNVRPLLRGGGALYSRTISAFVYESTIADDMRALAERHASLDIGSYPYFRMGKWGTALVVRGTDRSLIDQVTDALGEVIRRHGVEPMEGEGAE